jgi:hypothetical protein
MLGQDMIETTVMKSEGVSTKNHHLEQSLFSFVSSANDNCLYVYPLSIIVKLESPSSFVERISYSLIQFKPASISNEELFDESDGRPKKRLKISHNESEVDQEMEDVMYEVQIMSELILATLDDDRI